MIERVTNEKTGGQKDKKAEAYAYLPWEQIGSVARVYEMGAEKYSPWNWTKGYDWSLSVSSLFRHISSFTSGEDFDPESGEPHLAHAVFHCLALMYFMKYHPDLDDRHLAPCESPVLQTTLKEGDIITFADISWRDRWQNSKVIGIENEDDHHLYIRIVNEDGITGSCSEVYIDTVNGVPYEYN